MLNSVIGCKKGFISKESYKFTINIYYISHQLNHDD